MQENYPVIQTESLFKTYNETQIPVHALNGVSLEIGKQEFTALVGPSGSGKTTLLNIIGGLDTPTKGIVRVSNTDISQLKENQLIDFRLHHIGFVFQHFNLIPVLTAFENIEFIMLLQNRPAEERKERVWELLRAIGMEEKANSRPNELSGGQQQRVAVARALASRPGIILADEPTANLDSVSAGNLLDMMHRLNREEQVTFVFSTHDQRVIDRAERVITLRDGKIETDDWR